jgi:ribosomal protein S12 methylthiotransferase accessory factor
VPTVGGETPADQIQALVERVEAQGAHAYVVDVTAPDVREAGLAVAKVVVPELCSLDVSYATRFLGGRRLYEAPWRLGLAPRAESPADLNPYPHPFP